MALQGCYTALVTPFENGAVAWNTLKELIEAQIAGGVDGILPVGTTGESPTLNVEEHLKVIKTVIDTANGRCKVMAGTGANSTAEAIELTKEAIAMGADSTLQVTPYYSKPTQEGLYRHFSEVADLGLPVVLYNVPGRAGVPIAVDTVVRLAEHENIAAVKEAAGSADRVSQILSRTDKINCLSGDDALTLPMMILGGKGIISVCSNLLPKEVSTLAHLALDGRWEEAREQHYRLYEIFDNLFIETNPIPVKAAMAMAGMIKEEYRLPICEMTPANREILRQSLIKFGLDV